MPVEYVDVAGRDVGKPGDKYHVKLHVSGKWRTVTWDKIRQASELASVPAGDFYVCASWNDFTFQRMEPNKSTPGLFQLDVPLRTKGSPTLSHGEFQIVRNRDWNQSFYPADAGSRNDKTCKVAGPDGEGNGLMWELSGAPGETFRIEFQRTVDREEDVKSVS